ncbi:fumarylacetoacetate hydrolase family protein [Streptomyces sp. NPDC059629]|uniref:fumarylacetoacetate hydrolase family protein n=1 Tax=Streptomyces sp. NPDC059629 TaxID=3346889 RepID=UPI0036A0434D
MIGRLAQVITLRPGDVILTGTPAGVGMGHNPPRYLAPGDVLTSHIEGTGTPWNSTSPPDIGPLPVAGRPAGVVHRPRSCARSGFSGGAPG